MPRKVRVATLSIPERASTVETNRERVLSLVDAAGAQGADLICLPEAALHIGVRLAECADGPEPVPGPFSNELAARARHYGAYIVAGLYAKEGDAISNLAVAIDRQGQLVGCYVKVHPTEGEMDAGVRPGNEPLVVEADFGRLGFGVCFDIDWPAHWRRLAELGAELVVWPAAYDGGFPLQAYAWMHQYYVVSTVRGFHSKVIDPTGQVLASTSRWSRLTAVTVDLEKEVFHIDHQEQKLLQIQKELGSRVTARAFSEENMFTLESNDAEWPVARIKAEYGLENFREYHARVTALQDAARGVAVL